MISHTKSDKFVIQFVIVIEFVIGFVTEFVIVIGFVIEFMISHTIVIEFVTEFVIEFVIVIVIEQNKKAKESNHESITNYVSLQKYTLQSRSRSRSRSRMSSHA